MIKAELPTETTVQHFQRMLINPVYGFQEKHNGYHLMVCKQDGVIRTFNREGEPSDKPFPESIRRVLLRHPIDTFVIDCELVRQVLFIFDALFIGEDLVHNAYEYREAKYHEAFSGYAYIIPVKTACTYSEKKVLWDDVERNHGEGIVAKNLDAAYVQGRADQHFKLKFWKECDAVVIGPSPEGKDSVEIGMYDIRGRMKRVSGCSLRGKFRLHSGQVIKVRFLYATRDRNIVQPTLLGLRTDKKAGDCKLAQLDLYINKNWMATA